jgi:hypothetical protein
VNDSSQQQTFTITSNDNSDESNNIVIHDWDSLGIPALTSTDIITLTGSTTSSSYTIGNIETIDLSHIDTFTSFTNFYKDEFDGRFPDYERVQEMCKEYPGLDIAYRKFKEVYKMVKEDFDGKERERRGKY